MSEVYLATSDAGASVVVKLLGERQARDPAMREHLRAEAELGRAPMHPNIVRVLDFHGDDADPFVVLEHVDGVDLWRLQRALHQTQRRMEAPLACHVVRELLAGIQFVHTLPSEHGSGLVHRDVSPSNVFLSREGEVKLGDFGIAVSPRQSMPPPGSSGAPAAPGLSGRSGHPTPATGSVSVRVNRGKVGYMAPEHLLGMSSDHRTDLFSAGVVLAEVLMGRPLFATLQATELGALLQLRERTVEGLTEVLGDHPGSLVSVVLRALARSAAERFQSADEFRAALAPHASSPTEARPLLSALVNWARGAVRPSSSGLEAVDPRASAPPKVTLEPAGDKTRPVPDAFFEVLDSAGAVRGRYTWARLVELALADQLGHNDPLRAPDGRVITAADLPELVPVLPQRTAPTSEVAGGVADWADSLSTSSFLHALARLVFADESGMLVAEAAPARKEVYLARGRPTHLGSNLAGDGLGRFLVEQGHLNSGELDMALAMAPRSGGDLARAIVDLGLMEQSAIDRVAERFARERMLDLFRWHRGTLRFFRGVEAPSTAMPVNLDAFEILRSGALLLEDPQRHFESLLDRRVGIATTVRGLHRLGLGPVGHDLLAHADGMHTVTRLAARVTHERRVPQTEVLRELYFLLEVGALELRV